MYLSVIPFSASELVVSGNSFSRSDNSSIIESITAVTVTFFSTTKCFFTFLACLCSWAIFSPMVIPSWMGDMVRQIRTGFDRVAQNNIFLFIPVSWKTLRAHFWCVCVCIFEGEFSVFWQPLSNKVFFKKFLASNNAEKKMSDEEREILLLAQIQPLTIEELRFLILRALTRVSSNSSLEFIYQVVERLEDP